MPADAAYGASPEIIFEGKPFKEVQWFYLVDKEMDLVSRMTNSEIQVLSTYYYVCPHTTTRFSSR
jgi:hypothetical protein